MDKVTDLKEIEAQIKEKLGDIVTKCGIMIVLFKQAEGRDGMDIWEFGNINAQERLQLMTSIVVAAQEEQISTLVERLQAGDKLN